MMSIKFAVLTICTTFQAIAAVNLFVPEDREIVYDWNAIVKAETPLPTPHASLFVLNGKLHLQSATDSTYVKITNLTYKLYNGILNRHYENEAHEVPLPKEAENIEKIFKILYNEEGLVNGIVTEQSEQEFSRNIKKAIATILQVNLSAVGKEYHHPESFVTQENSLYGYGFVDYTVYPQGNDTIEVHKLYDLHDPGHLYKNSIINGENFFWDKNFEHPLMHSNKKIYTIVRSNGHKIVKHIHSGGTIVYYPYQAKSDDHHIVVSQTFVYVEEMSKETDFYVKFEHFEQNLTYHAYQNLEGVIDTTNGRQDLKYSRLMKEVQNILKDIPVYLKEDHINTQQPDSKRGQQVNRLEELLSKFNKEKLIELEKSLDGESLDIFYNILPLIGTSATTLHVKNLIINKVVSDDTAAAMLQKFWENIMPSVELLEELDSLIHLNETYNWEVRKIALLCFGSLIHKSYIYAKQQEQSQSEEQLQEPYKIYVEDYVTRLKATNEYYVQMVYIFGLRNMQLPVVLKHLVPAFSGEWWQDQHLRYLSLWGSTAGNPATLMETLWPILTNREELTEMRILAYYFFMKSKPGHSRLQNLFSYMLTETNEEVYNYHYTFLQAAIQSKDAYNTEMRIKLSQLMKFSPPPRHGVSVARYFDYTDANHGFGVDIEDHFVRRNGLRFHTMYLKSHYGVRVQEEYAVYVKFYGEKFDHGVMFNILESLLATLGIRFGDGNYIEGAIAKRNHIINCYYFGKKNFQTIDKIFSETALNVFNIRYLLYQRALIPTDIGFPAVWEFMMPEVYQNKISMRRNESWEIENRYSSWIHFRHGLSFYNPISDIWQGVNRYHSYDAVFPITLELKPHKMIWKKHANSFMNVAGLRSHVKQVVFVKDNYRRNTLKQSSPNCKEFQTVGDFKHFKHNNTLFDFDDLNSGHRWFMGIFDSDFPISNGSFKHQLHLFIQTSTKRINSPSEHLLLSYLNWLHYTFLLPDPGNYGCLMRIEPSTVFNVSFIDFWLFIDNENTLVNNPLVPGIKLNSNLVYAVGNENGYLKAWDLIIVLDLNPGHTILNLKLNLTCKMPGEKHYKFCVESVKKWHEKGVTGRLTLQFGRRYNNSCPSDGVVDIVMSGNPSSEQLASDHKYASCQHLRPDVLPPFTTLECKTAPASLRHYKYFLTTTGISTQIDEIINYLVGFYQTYASYTKNHGNGTEIDVVFPMEVDEVNFRISTPTKIFDLTGVPANYLRLLGFIPDNTVFPQSLYARHRSGQLNHCLVYSNYIKYNEKMFYENVPSNWTVYLEDGTSQNRLYMKFASNTSLAVKFQAVNHTLELIPHDDSFQLVLDGQEMVLEEQRNEKWIYYRSLMDDLERSVVFWLHEIGVGIQYYISHAKIVVPADTIYQGHCFAIRT